MSRTMILVVTLILALAPRAHAETLVSGELAFTIIGGAALKDVEQEQFAAKLVEGLQSRLTPLVALKDFSSSTAKGTVHVRFYGEWRDAATSKDAVEKIRVAATGPQGGESQRCTLGRIRVEVKDVTKDSPRGEQRMEQEVRVTRSLDKNDARPPARTDETPELQSRPGPRLLVKMQPDKKSFEEFTALDVPLQWVLDQLGRTAGVSYLYDREMAHIPVYLSLRQATVEQVLQGIAESTRLKLVRKGEYVTFAAEKR